MSSNDRRESPLKNTLKLSRGILRHYEEDYKADLGVHLYSTFLLHKLSPQFPPRRWASWPMPSSQVLDPQGRNAYVKEPEGGDTYDISVVKASDFVNFDANHKSEKFISDEVLQEEDEDEQMERAKAVGFFHEQTNRPEVTDATANIKVEIERLYKRKIYDNISKKGHKIFEVEPSVDSFQVPENVYKDVLQKFDDLMNQFSDRRGSSITNITHTWMDILLATQDEDPQVLSRIMNAFTEEADGFLEGFKNQAIHDFESDEKSEEEEESDASNENEVQGKEMADLSSSNTPTVDEDDEYEDHSFATDEMKNARNELAVKLLTHKLQQRNTSRF